MLICSALPCTIPSNEIADRVVRGNAIVFSVRDALHGPFFLHVIATSNSEWGHMDERSLPEKSPNLTNYGPELFSLAEMIGGWECPDVIAVIKIQKS